MLIKEEDFQRFLVGSYKEEYIVKEDIVVEDNFELTLEEKAELDNEELEAGLKPEKRLVNEQEVTIEDIVNLSE